MCRASVRHRCHQPWRPRWQALLPHPGVDPALQSMCGILNRFSCVSYRSDVQLGWIITRHITWVSNSRKALLCCSILAYIETVASIWCCTGMFRMLSCTHVKTLGSCVPVSRQRARAKSGVARRRTLLRSASFHMLRPETTAVPPSPFRSSWCSLVSTLSKDPGVPMSRPFRTLLVGPLSQNLAPQKCPLKHAPASEQERCCITCQHGSFLLGGARLQQVPASCGKQQSSLWNRVRYFRTQSELQVGQFW